MKIPIPILLPGHDTDRPDYNSILVEGHSINLLDVHYRIGTINRKELENASKDMISLSKCDSFHGKAFYLNSDYDWVLGRTSNNRIILIPLDPDYPSEKILKQLSND